MAKHKESMSFYSDGKVFAKKREHGNISGEYELLNDAVENNVRTITLKLCDKAEHLTRVKELAKLMCEKMGEQGRAFKQLLEDTLIDYKDEEVIRMLGKVKDEEPVKARKGCFQVIIGDGRKLDSEVIQLRD